MSHQLGRQERLPVLPGAGERPETVLGGQRPRGHPDSRHDVTGDRPHGGPIREGHVRQVQVLAQ